MLLCNKPFKTKGGQRKSDRKKDGTEIGERPIRQNQIKRLSQIDRETNGQSQRQTQWLRGRQRKTDIRIKTERQGTGWHRKRYRDRKDINRQKKKQIETQTEARENNIERVRKIMYMKTGNIEFLIEKIE